MKYTISSLIIGIALICYWQCSLAHSSHTSKHSKMTKLIQVRDSIYYIEGHGGNIGVLKGDEGIVLIDDQFEHQYEAIISALTTISKAPVKYVINTHWRVDHTNGNEKFGALGSDIIAHSNSHKRMTTDQFINVFNHHQKPYSEKGLPKMSFNQDMELRINQETIHLFHVKNAHTDGDIIVHFKKHNVIHTGDVFVTYGYPFIDEPNGGTIHGVIAAIEKLLLVSDSNTLIIPGHGHLSKKEDLEEYLLMLKTILTRIEKQMALKKNLAEIIATNPTSGYSSQKINKAIFVEIIVNNLTKLANE